MLRQSKLGGGLSPLDAAQQLHPLRGFGLGGGVLLHGQLKVPAEVIGIIAVGLHPVVGKTEKPVDLAVICYRKDPDAQLCRPGTAAKHAFLCTVRGIVGMIVAIYQHCILFLFT